MTDHISPIPRDVVYRRLAQVFLHPLTEQDLQNYSTADGQTFLAACKTDPSLAELATTIEQLTIAQDRAQQVRSLASEFSRAFEQGGPRAALPYASIFLSEKGLMYQAPTREMNGILSALSMTVPETVREPADHLAIQLQVAAEIAFREETGQPCPIPFHVFLEGQLMTWLPAFVERCSNRTRSGLILVAAKAVLATVQDDQERCLEPM